MDFQAHITVTHIYTNMKIDRLITAVKHFIIQLEKARKEKNFLFYTTEEKAEWLKANRRKSARNKHYLIYFIRKQKSVIEQIY